MYCHIALFLTRCFLLIEHYYAALLREDTLCVAPQLSDCLARWFSAWLGRRTCDSWSRVRLPVMTLPGYLWDRWPSLVVKLGCNHQPGQPSLASLLCLLNRVPALAGERRESHRCWMIPYGMRFSVTMWWSSIKNCYFDLPATNSTVRRCQMLRNAKKWRERFLRHPYLIQFSKSIAYKRIMSIWCSQLWGLKEQSILVNKVACLLS